MGGSKEHLASPFVALEDAGEPVRDPELSRAWKANDMKATLFALSQFLHRDQMDRGPDYVRRAQSMICGATVGARSDLVLS